MVRTDGGDGLFKDKIMGLLAWQVWQYGMKSGSVVCGEIRESGGLPVCIWRQPNGEDAKLRMVCVFVYEVQLRSRQVHS